MKIRLEQSAFAEVVAWVQRAVGTRSTPPALGGILFRAEGEQVSLSGTDLDLAARASVGCAVEQPGSVLLPGRLLGEIARNLPEGAVRIDADGPQVAIASGSAAFSLRTLPLEDFPELGVPSGVTGIASVADLVLAINQVARASSSDEARPVLTGINVEASADKAVLVATDSYRLAVRELAWKGPADDTKRVVPARAFTEAARMGSDGDATITLGDTQIGFDIAGRVLTSRLIEGEFPNWRGLIPDELPNRLTVDKELFIEAVRRVGLLATAGTPVKIELSESGAKLHAGSQDIGDADETVDAKYEGEALTVAFNPQYLLDGVQAIASTEVVLCVRDGLKPAVLRASQEDGFLYLVMPVRL